MTMASGLYVPTFEGAMGTQNLTVDLDLTTNKVILVTDTHTPDFQLDNDYSDIDNEVAAAGGYTQNNKTVGGAPSYGWASTNRLKYTWSAPVVWSSSTITARGLILTTAVTTGLLVVAVTFGQDYISTNGDFSITAHGDGVFYITMYA